jgi:poly-gamma-glutamate capsule biosynthesis protein CapA/YwtB (metallophosphatase superfamily)
VTSGIHGDWAAAEHASGLDLLPEINAVAADQLAARVAAVKQRGDIAVISIHWGSNWGFDVPEEFIQFAHRLIEGGVDLVHGHSSHQVRPIEVYRDLLILYGCGDLIDDYEGIAREAMQKRREQGGGKDQAGWGGIDPERRQMFMEKFDTDGDGKLSETERAAAKAARAKRGR